MVTLTYKKRGPRYTPNEIALITALIKNRVDLVLWNGDTIRVDQSENLLTTLETSMGKNSLEYSTT